MTFDKFEKISKNKKTNRKVSIEKWKFKRWNGGLGERRGMKGGENCSVGFFQSKIAANRETKEYIYIVSMRGEKKGDEV